MSWPSATLSTQHLIVSLYSYSTLIRIENTIPQVLHMHTSETNNFSEFKPEIVSNLTSEHLPTAIPSEHFTLSLLHNHQWNHLISYILQANLPFGRRFCNTYRFNLLQTYKLQINFYWPIQSSSSVLSSWNLNAMYWTSFWSSTTTQITNSTRGFMTFSVR